MPNGNQWCGPLAGVFFFKATPMTYAEKLRDPRWIETRNRILERDNRICQRCKNEDSDYAGEVHVHHQVYLTRRDPWEYEDHELITLCEKCHMCLHDVAELVHNRIEKAILWEAFDQWGFLRFLNTQIKDYVRDQHPEIYPYQETKEQSNV